MPPRAAQGRTLDASIEAAALYFGNVMHARLKPIRFSYRVMSLLIDPRPSRRRRPKIRSIRCEPRGTYSFHEADHGDRDGSSLRAYAQARAAEHGIDLSGGRVLLLSVILDCSATPSTRCRFISAIMPEAGSL